MKIEVEMLAFEDGKIRTVSVPADEAKGADASDLLDLAFTYGQNDFQPQAIASVSVGDVIRLERKRYRVEPCGFVEVDADNEPVPGGVATEDEVVDLPLSSIGAQVKCATCGTLYPLGEGRCPANACGRLERTLCQACGCDQIECSEVATGTFFEGGHTYDGCGEHQSKAY